MENEQIKHNKQIKMVTEDSSSNEEKIAIGGTHIKKFSKKFAIALVLIIIVVLGLVVYKQTHKPQVKTITAKKQVVVRRSKDLGLITRGLTGKAVDVNTGKIVKAARIFSLDDKAVYLQLDLQSAPKGTVIDYIRYKNGRYVDHGELTIAKNDIKNVLFNWTISNLLANLTEGKWKVATYSNGILAKRILYEISKNKISYVYPEDTIEPNDPDYNLHSSLIAASKNH